MTLFRNWRRLLLWAHRWLGVVTCLFCCMWFVSGLVMVYVPFPSFSDRERSDLLPPIDANAIHVLPEVALTAAAIKRSPTVFRLEMWGSEPVYRVYDFGRPTTVSATDGRRIENVSWDEAAAVLATLYPKETISFVSTLSKDQWTVQSRYDAHRPLHQFRLSGDDGIEIYVSSRDGEIVQMTSRRERLWNWLGSVPHWLYFTTLRSNGEVWRQVVMWTAGVAVLGAILGMWIGVIRIWRQSGRLKIPYRGWMKWHHVAGLMGGVTMITWLASGWLSVSPFQLFNSLPITPDQLGLYYNPGTPSFSTTLTALNASVAPGVKVLELSWVAGSPVLIGDDGKNRTLRRAEDGQATILDLQRVRGALNVMLKGVSIKHIARLDHDDAHWYSHVSSKPLPVYRAVLGDPGETWITIDGVSGRIVGFLSSDDRLYRWLFNFLHQYDHPYLLERPWLRLSLVWAMSILGLVVSLSGVVIAYRRLVWISQRQRLGR